MSLACALATASLLLQQPTDGARVALAPAPRLHWESPGLFDAYLPGCLSLRSTPEGVIAFAQDACYRVVDLDRGTSESSSGPRGEARYSDSFVARDGDRIVVLADETLSICNNGEWSPGRITWPHDAYAPPVHRILLDGTTLYVGTDKGEWGGALYSTDIFTGAMDPISSRWPDGDSNVSDIDRGPDGRIWVTAGCAHMDGSGELYVQNGRTWQLVAKTDET